MDAVGNRIPDVAASHSRLRHDVQVSSQSSAQRGAGTTLVAAQQPPSDWTAAEQALWRAFRDGGELNLRDPDPTRNDPLDGGDWKEPRTLRASVIAQLLLNPPDLEPGHSARLRLIGARITGKLDLGCGTVAPFLFQGCRFDNSPNLNDCIAAFVAFSGSYLPGLEAARLTCNGPVWMDRVRSNGIIMFANAKIHGGVRLRNVQLDDLEGDHRLCLCDASINGNLLLSDAKIGGTVGLNATKVAGDVRFSATTITSTVEAISARQASISGSVIALRDFGCTGTVQMEGVHIRGQLLLGGAHISSKEGAAALDLDHARIDLGLLARKIKVDGQILMHHAQIGCQVSLRGAKLSNQGDVALRADHLVVDGSLMLDEKTDVEGQINLHGAEVKCALEISDATIESVGMSAIRADGIRVHHHLLAQDCHVTGAINLADATVGGSMVFTDATLEHDGNYVFDARRMTVSGRVTMDGKFSSVGAVSFADAAIGTDFYFNDSKFAAAHNRICLDLTGSQVQGDVVGNRARIEGFCDLAAIKCGGDVRLADATITGVPANVASLGSPVDKRKGGTWRGVALRATSASIAGDLDLRSSTLGESLVLTKATIGHSVLLTDASLSASDGSALVAIGTTAETLDLRLKAQPRANMDLTSGNINSLTDSPTSWPISAEIKIDGFRYRRLDSALTPPDRLRWLSRATRSYTPQPYEQLASYYIANGNADEARKVNLESIRRSYRARGPMFRVWGKIQDWSLGYGYQPVRAVIIFLTLWITASIWFATGVGPCVRFGVRWTNLCPDALVGHSTWSPWLYSFDLLLPIVNLGYKTAWDPTGISRIIALILIVAGWVLTTTIVAAMGRILRRS